MPTAQEVTSPSIIEAGDDTTFEIPALGQQMRLGMVYDCRSDQPIPAFSMWNRSVLDKNRDVRHQQETLSDIITSDSIEARLEALDISGSLKASVLSGLVKLKGSAKFMDIQQALENQSRVTLRYRSTVRYEELSMDHLGKYSIEHSDVFEKGVGTHVILGILYGVQAFFVFEKFLGETEEKIKVDEMLQSAVERVPSRDFRETCKTRQENPWEGIRCLFYGDVSLTNNPTNFKEAVSSYGELSTMLGKHGELAVPLAIWLYPLAKLEARAIKFIKEIDISLVSYLQNMLQYLRECKACCDIITMNPVCKDLLIFAEKLEVFQKLLQEFKHTFKDRVSQLLPKIRDGRSNEQNLRELLSSVQTSPFDQNCLREFIKSLKRKVDMVEVYTKELGTLKFMKSVSDLDKLAIESKTVVLCLSFAPLVRSEHEQLSKMSQYLDSQSEYKQNDTDQGLDATCIQELPGYVKRFKEYAEANKDSGREISFALIGFDADVCTKDNKLVTAREGFMYLFENGTFQTFDIPTAVSQLHVVSKAHNAVTLTWSPPKVGLTNVKTFWIRYREKMLKGNEWTGFCTGDTKSTVTIPNLNIATTYEFQVASGCIIGMCPYSEPSVACTTLPLSPPLNVRQGIASFDIIQLMWDEPTLKDKDVCIEKYMVKYITADKDGADEFISKEAKDSKCFHAISGLVTNTTYRVSVSAVCDSGEESVFSEEVKVRTASERPQVPGKPIILGTTHNTVSLEWTPAGSTEYINQYKVYYRDCSTARGHSNGWIVFHTSGNDTNVCIPKLNSNIAYEFSVSADYGIWTSNLGVVSEACTTRLASAPLNLQKKETTQNSVTIAWDHPKYVSKVAPITKYKVKYQSASTANAEFSSVEETKGTDCVHIITELESSVSYMISVSAVCGEAGRSVFSEPVEIKCKPRTAVDVANRLNPTQNEVSLEGNVSILKLPLTKTSNTPSGNYHTYHFGEENGKCNQHIVLMLIGTKGSGKSMLLNAMINYILDVRWEDNFRFSIIADERENRSGNRNKSQTQYISSYTVNPPAGSKLDYKLTVIDTPVFERGNDSESDNHMHIIEHIRKFLLDTDYYVNRLNAVGLVSQASQANQTLWLKYIFNSVFLNAFRRLQGKCHRPHYIFGWAKS